MRLYIFFEPILPSAIKRCYNELMRISYSSLETYKNCPLKYKYQEIDKIKSPKSAEGIFGSAVHSALKFMFQRNPLYPTLDEVIDFFREKWESRKALISPPLEDEQNIMLNEGINIIKNFYKHNQPWNFNVVGLEAPFEVAIKDGSEENVDVLSGRIDRIDKNDDGYEIIDYKTSRKMPAQKDLENDLQMSIYNIALLNQWPNLQNKEVRLSFYFLKHGEKASFTRTAQQLKETEKLIAQKIAEIKEKAQTSDFPATPSGLCDYCGYRKMCPMWRHMYQSQIPKAESQSEEQIKQAVREYFDLKENSQKNTKRLSELKIILFGFMDEQKVERLFGEEGYITKSVLERIFFDFDRVKEALEPIGWWQNILEPDNKKLIEAFPHLPENVQQKIIEARTKKQTPSLKIAKKKIKKQPN